MPARSPPIDTVLTDKLAGLGARIRAHRRRHKVTAASAAEAAGMSRVTLHRIERGEPSVTMGAYASAMAAIGLEFALVDSQQLKADPLHVPLPARIPLEDYPELKRLAWQRQGADDVSPAEALNLYERNWRHVDESRMRPTERALLQALVAKLGAGRLLV